MAKDNQKVRIKTNDKAKYSSGYRELDIKKLDRTPMADYYAFKDKIVNVENYVYYSTACYAAGTAITTDHEAELFTRGASQPSVIVNTGAAIPRAGEFLTNMVTDGEFDNSTSFLLEAIAVDFMLTSEPPTTVTNGAIIAPAHTAVATYSAANHFLAISRQFKLEFIRGEKQIMLDGQLFEFPSPFVASGAFGSSLGGFIQNGFAGWSWNKLSEIHALMSNDRFSVKIRPLVTGFTPQVAFNIRVMFIGKRIQTLYS